MISMADKLKVALVHDYLREYGGAERVVELLHEMYPDAPLYTAFVDREALGIHWQRFAAWDIHESVASKIPFIKNLYSPLRLFAAYFFEGFDLSSYDVVISSTNMYMAKSVLTQPKTLHVCYVHTPPRPLYGLSSRTNWRKNPVTRIVGELINYWMRPIDFLGSQRPDLLIANSHEVGARIKKYYRRDAVVIYPPVRTSNVGEVKREDYFLYAGRLVYAKHPELAVAACTAKQLPLKIVGAGPMERKLRDIAGPSVTFLGAVNDMELSTLYAGAKALLFPVEDEDFGMVPVEAMMAGTPVIAHNSGGPKETVIDETTGVLFDTLTQSGLEQAIDRFETLDFNAATIRAHADKFAPEKFQQHVRQLIERQHKKTSAV